MTDQVERVAKAISEAHRLHGRSFQEMARAAIAAMPAPTVQEAAKVLLDVVEHRKWSHYPIEMPLTINGNGPAKVGRDAHCMTYEVWEADTLRAVSDHNKLPDAIAAWLRALAEQEAPNDSA